MLLPQQTVAKKIALATTRWPRPVPPQHCHDARYAGGVPTCCPHILHDKGAGETGLGLPEAAGESAAGPATVTAYQPHLGVDDTFMPP